MNDYGQLAMSEDYRRGLDYLRKKLAKKHKADPVRCVFSELKTSANWILDLPATKTNCLKERELDALILLRRYLREGE